MILIFSENISYSARYVTRHLHRLKENFDVFLESDKIEFNYNFNSDSAEIGIYKNETFVCNYSDIKSVWAHRSEIQVQLCADKTTTNEEKDYVVGHSKTRIESIQSLLHKKKCLGRFGKLNYNKITFLEVCIELSIPIPKTLITNQKKDFISFIFENEEVIVKSLANNYYHCLSSNDNEEIWQKGTTQLITVNDIDKIPENFATSLFQEKLNKEYEIRILYVAGKTFSQVIFSQGTNHSKIDYREGLGDTEMRQCGYILPEQIEEQISILMDRLGLNIGCIDVVKTKDGRYVFLEVNPSGIFTDMMDNCDYDMHFEIAKFLKDEK